MGRTGDLPELLVGRLLGDVLADGGEFEVFSLAFEVLLIVFGLVK